MQNNESPKNIAQNDQPKVKNNKIKISSFNLWIIILAVSIVVCVPISFWVGRYFSNSVDTPAVDSGENDSKENLKNGVWLDDDGEIRYYVDNVAVYAGLVRNTTGDYYYISSNGLTAVKNITRYVSFTNDLLPEGTYTFGQDGKMLISSESDESIPQEAIKNGVYLDEDGEIRCYVDNVAVYAGLVRNTTGDYYYISNNGLTAVKNITRHISFTNDLLPEGIYTFGSDGKLIFSDAPEQDSNITDNENQPGKDDETIPPIDENVPGADQPIVTPEQPKPDIVTPVISVNINANFIDDKVVFITPEVQKYLASNIRDERNVDFRPTEWLKPTIRFDTQITTKISISLKDAIAVCYKIELADNEQLINAFVDYISSDITSYSFKHLYSNTKYYYRITAYTLEDGVIYTTGSFKTADTPRILSVPGLYNVRDIGNWVTDSGKRIKQGLLLRGTEMDAAEVKYYYLTTIGLWDMFNTFKIRTDLDLRAKTDNTKDALGATVMHKYYDMVMYNSIFTESGMAKIREVFTDLANPDNYPIYLHCTYGCDRTGTVCYLLEALLGVSPDDCLKEYGLSNMPLKYILAVEEKLNQFGGQNLKENVEIYLLSCGVTKEQIESIRNIFLGD